MKEGEKNTEKTLKDILKDNDFLFVKDYKVFRTLGLKPLERAILSEILSFNVQSKEYTGSFTYIQKEFNVSKDTAIRALKKLVNDEYLIKNASKGGNISIYSINEIKIKSLFLNSLKIRGLDEQTVAKLEGKQSQNQTVNSRKIRHNKNIYKNKYKNNIYSQSEIDTVSFSQEDNNSNTKKEADTKVPTSEKKKNTSSKKKQEEKYLQMFNEFWQLYPKKRAKANALKIWLKLKPSDELFKQILSAVKTQSNSEDWLKEKGKYIPYPTTWLNGERWEDEITEAAGNSQPQETEPCKKPYYQEPFATF